MSDAELVAGILDGFDPADGFSRTPPFSTTPPKPPVYFTGQLRFGIPLNPQWFGDKNAELAWEQSLENFKALGAELVPVDFTPMFTLAQLLYGGAWIAERHAAVAEFMQEHADDMNPVVRGIIENAVNFSATDAYRSEYRRADLAREIQTLMSGFDALVVPTSPRHPTTAEVDAEPVLVNSQLGTYTNFVNLADCSALALPAAMRKDGLPFGITLIAPAWQDAALVKFGKVWQVNVDLNLGITNRKAPMLISKNIPPANYVRIAVVGAHLTGMPLNVQLQERNAIFVESAFTSNSYRLFALPNTTPPKPGLIRGKAGEIGAEINVELWDVPLQYFGSFVALIPAPLGIGTLTLDDGREVKGFICEGAAVEGAADITHLGGWRAYIASLKK